MDFPGQQGVGSLGGVGALREFSDHHSQGVGGVAWRVPSARGPSARRCFPDDQWPRLDRPHEAHRCTGARSRHIQPSVRFAGPDRLADHGCRPRVPSGDREAPNAFDAGSRSNTGGGRAAGGRAADRSKHAAHAPACHESRALRRLAPLFGNRF